MEEEIVRCPFCGLLVFEGDIEKPASYCHHNTLTEEKDEQCLKQQITKDSRTWF